MAKKGLKKGIFITFEGPDGCGKSTHSALAAKFLRKAGFDVVYTREPGGTAAGNRIRNILLNAKKARISPLTEVFLFEAARSELVKQVIKPALDKKKIVISDRFNDATLVYQGYAGSVPLGHIKRIEDISTSGVKPDLTVLLDIGAKKGLSKIELHKRDRMESKPLSFHDRVRRGYLDLASRDRKRIKVIKTGKTIEETFGHVEKEVACVVDRYIK